MDNSNRGANGNAPRLFTAAEMRKECKKKPVQHELPLDRAVLERLPLGPAFRALLEGPVDAIMPALRERWARAESEAVAAFAMTLLEEASPVRIIEGIAAVKDASSKGSKGQELYAIDMGAWLELGFQSDIEDAEGGNGFFLGEPRTRDEVVASLESAGIAPQPAIVEFFTAFSRLRDAPPGESGHFSLPSADQRFDAEDHEDEDGSREAWNGAAIIYSAQNGDEILLNAEGEVAWAVLETGNVRAIGPFEALLQAYPVDSYSWPD